MSRIIAVSNHKGGVGKTTSVVNIGVGLTLAKKKVLLVDLDPQANLSQSFGIEEPAHTIYGVLKGEYEIQPVNIRKNLDLVPSELNLSGAEIELSAQPGREYILREQLNKFKDMYDYILIDCPPALGLLTINALTSAEEVFLPLQAEYLALRGLDKLNNIIELVQNRLNDKIKITGVIVTQFDKRKVLNRDIEKAIRENFGSKVFKNVIRDNIALAEAPTMQTDIFSYAKNSAGAKDYKVLVKEIINMK